MDPGDRNQFIIVERGTAVPDDYSSAATFTWAEYATAWAQVRRGTGQERREAAQEAGSQAATFNCDWTPVLDTVRITDRIQYRGDAWDIVDVAPDANFEIQFTAVRST